VYALLLALSTLLQLADVALAAAGVWMIVSDPWFWPIAGGPVLIGLAACFRPRLGRLKPLLGHGYLVERKNAPTLHRMIDRLAADLRAPRPDVVIFDFGFNAGVTRVGPRQIRVLTLGVPLLLALTPQQMVALGGHELGHLKYEDNRRRLLLQPAATFFGRLARVFRPPHMVARARAAGRGGGGRTARAGDRAVRRDPAPRDARPRDRLSYAANQAGSSLRARASAWR
jgi:heat shock protein HtpX